MTDTLRVAIETVDRILAYGEPVDRKAALLLEKYQKESEPMRYALFAAVAGRLMVEMTRKRYLRVPSWESMDIAERAQEAVGHDEQ